MSDIKSPSEEGLTIGAAGSFDDQLRCRTSDRAGQMPGHSQVWQRLSMQRRPRGPEGVQKTLSSARCPPSP